MEKNEKIYPLSGNGLAVNEVIKDLIYECR